MTQAEFGQLVNAHAVTVCRWEKEAPSVKGPDKWQLDVMKQLHKVSIEKPEAADTARKYLAAGLIGVALGILLGIAKIKTQSIYIPLAMHAFVNSRAMAVVSNLPAGIH